MVLDSRMAMSLLPVIMHYLGADTPFHLIVRTNDNTANGRIADITFGKVKFTHTLDELLVTVTHQRSQNHLNTYSLPIFENGKIIGGIAISVNGKENLETVENFLNEFVAQHF